MPPAPITGPRTLKASRVVSLASGSSLGTVGGTITLEANQPTPATNGNFIGVDIDGGTVSTGAGAITLTGRGGDAGDENIGVQVRDGVVSSTGVGAAAITINGRGGDSTGVRNWGFVVRGANAAVQSATGNIDITGEGGAVGSSGDNEGVYLLNGGEIRSTGSGGGAATITIEGTGGDGGSNNPGINIFDFSSGNPTGITSTDGAIDLTGIGGGTGPSSSGIRMEGLDAFIRSTAAASISLDGTGSPAGIGIGVEILDGSTVDSQGTGAIAITGTGSADSYAVYVAGPVSAASGKILIDGVHDSGGLGADVRVADTSRRPRAATSRSARIAMPCAETAHADISSHGTERREHHDHGRRQRWAAETTTGRSNWRAISRRAPAR